LRGDRGIEPCLRIRSHAALLLGQRLGLIETTLDHIELLSVLSRAGVETPLGLRLHGKIRV
jgi:hypothetical protein